MNPLTGEFIGTLLMILLGEGVCANVALSKTKGHSSGWIVVTFGWAIAVFVGVFCVGSFSGAHLNPAVTIGLALAGKFAWASVPGYIAAQMLGAMAGAFLVWVQYKQHFDATEEAGSILGVFCTGPEIRSMVNNFLSEVIGTFVLVFGILYIAAPATGIGAISALPVAFLVLGIGLSLGGTTGYAINPARDLGPRIVHAFLPIKNKKGSDWAYAWVPVAGPIVGALIAANIYNILK